MAELLSKPDSNIADILIKVQHDLHRLKNKFTESQENGETVDIQLLETAIQRTEIGLRNHAEQYLKALNREVLTLPSVTKSTAPAAHSAGYDSQSNANKLPRTPVTHPTLSDRKSQPVTLGQIPQHISPGAQHKLAMNMKILNDPSNAAHRSLLNQAYGIQLPQIKSLKPESTHFLKPIKGSTVEPLATLPITHRRNPSLLPPPISERDAKKGILSLQERGLIPPAAELTLHPPPLLPQAMPLHDIQEKHRKPAPEPKSENSSKVVELIIRKSSLHMPQRSAMITAAKAALQTGMIAPPPTSSSKGPLQDFIKDMVQHQSSKSQVHIA
uniref:Uncharacterized protein n=1 Tax=Callorhinchus milii TaxID=7868 RepID=A0A4W3J0R0_CALMI